MEHEETPSSTAGAMQDGKNEQPIKCEKEQEHEDAPTPMCMATDASESTEETEQGQTGELLKRSKDQRPQKQRRTDQGCSIEKAEEHAGEAPCEPAISTDDAQDWSTQHCTDID